MVTDARFGVEYFYDALRCYIRVTVEQTTNFKQHVGIRHELTQHESLEIGYDDFSLTMSSSCMVTDSSSFPNLNTRTLSSVDFMASSIAFFDSNFGRMKLIFSS